jgi:hypothetical protein
MKAVKIMIYAATVLMVVFVFMGQAPDSSRIETSNAPKISKMGAQKMLVVEAKGDPNIVGAKAFALLFQTYFSLKETPKGPGISAPRARWPISFDNPKAEWVGLYALPVPDSISQLPAIQADSGLTVSLAKWEYGDVAEILHVGPYDKEEPTIKRLRGFISENGYVIAGPHEEEYIKGPTMDSRGIPEEYVTIIRYQVKKLPEAK